MSIAKDCDQKRVDMLKLGKRLADDGAHYLWSGLGETPGPGGRVKLADPVLTPGVYAGTQFCAATVDYEGTTYVCAGRAYHPGIGGKGKNFAALPNTDPVGAQKDKLDLFTKTYASRTTEQQGWRYSDLTPRTIAGNVTDYSTGGKIPMDGALVWGEGCDDTQHFDCNGFVNYVVRKTCTTNISIVMEGIGAKLKTGKFPIAFDQPMARVIEEGEELLPADILVWPGHVALLAIGLAEAKSTTYSKDASYPVSQAEDGLDGVNYGRKHGGARARMAGCIRLSPSVLLHRNVDANEVESDQLSATATP